MYLDERGSQPQAPPRVLAVPPPTGVNNRARPAYWWLSWPTALLVAGLVVGVVFAATDPDWDGTEPRNISESELDLARQPAIASGTSGRMVVAWSDQRSEGTLRNVYAVSSDNNGDTWSAVPEAISGGADDSLLPDALVVGDRVFVAWVDGDPPTAVYEAEKTEAGTWEAHYIPSPVPLSNTRPRLAADADRLHVVFNAGKNIPDILYAARSLATTVWPTATVIYTHTAALGSWYPVLAVGPDGETLHVVWEERTSASQRAIMYMRGTASGAGVDWASPITLSTGITLSLWPAIAADAGGNLHVVWGEQVGTGTVQEREQYARYTRYDAAGDAWSEPPVFRRIDDSPVRVNQLRPTDIAPGLALVERDNETEVCVAWHGFREDTFAEEVLLSCSWDGGQSWSPPRNVSRSPGAEAISIAPSIAFDARGRLHSVWEEHVGNSIVHNYEVYYTRALDNKVFLPLVVRS